MQTRCQLTVNAYIIILPLSLSILAAYNNLPKQYEAAP